MLLSRRLSLTALIDLSRSLRYALTGGVMLRDVMEMLATQGSRPVRRVAAKVVQDLKSGWGLQDALQKQQDAFPPLFLALSAVGEESGNLPEVLAELENYYCTQQRMVREFRSEITVPVAQLVAAVMVIAALIYVAGFISPRGPFDKEPFDPVGLGLMGPQGAAIFLGVVVGTVLLGAFGFWLLKRLFRRRALVERLLLRVPVIGPCLRAIALTRFCVAFHLTLGTSLSVLKMFRLVFPATDNAAFIAALPKAEAALRRGENIAGSLKTAGVFHEQFLSLVTVAEESGRLPEALRIQAVEFDEEAKRRLLLLNRAAGWSVWLCVATVIIIAIFRVFVYGYLQRAEKFM